MATEERFPIVRPPRAQPQPEPTTYVNGVAILFSPWDFSLLFVRGLPSDPLADDPEAGKRDPGWHQKAIRGEVVQRIVMSPEHAKAMAAQLIGNVEAYEREYGVVPSIVDSKEKPKTETTPRKRTSRSK